MGRFILLSLIVHLLIVLSLAQVPDDLFLAQQMKEQNNIEVEVVNKAEPDGDQIVRSAKAPEDQLAELKEKAKYLSEQSQRVLLETRAKTFGKTQNRVPQPQFLQDALKEKSRTMAQADPDDLLQKRLPRRAQKDLFDLGPSTNGDSLPNDIAVGSFTALNTDKFTYYSFYSRIEDLIRYRWETNVKVATDAFDRAEFQKIISQRAWTTQIEFLLNPHGDFVRARLLKSSGQLRYDQAPILAFRDARYFPNPPQELVHDDGYIHLLYSFQVNLNPDWLAHR